MWFGASSSLREIDKNGEAGGNWCVALKLLPQETSPPGYSSHQIFPWISVPFSERMRFFGGDGDPPLSLKHFIEF